MTKLKDRADIVAWIDSHETGTTIAAIAYQFGMCHMHMAEICRNLRKNGRVVLVGKVPLSRWATPKNVEQTQEWRDAHRAAVKAADKLRSAMKRKRYASRAKVLTISDDQWTPRQITVPASECKALTVGPRWVFDLCA